MPDKTETLQWLEKIREKFLGSDVKSKFIGFDRTLQFLFTDLEMSFHTRIQGEIMEPFSEGAIEKPNLLVTTDSETLIGILKGELSPLDAYSFGKLKAKGSMSDLLKLQVLM